MPTFNAFEIIATGGNCSALVVTLTDGRALFITDGDANAEPARDAYFIGLFPSYTAAIEWQDGDDVIEMYRTPDEHGAPTFADALGSLLGDYRALRTMARDYMRTSGAHLIETPVGRAILGAFAVCADTYHLHNRG